MELKELILRLKRIEKQFGSDCEVETDSDFLEVYDNDFSLVSDINLKE